jgi:putative endopeptidase
VDEIIVTQPEFFEKFDEILEEAGLESLKSWMLVRFILQHTSLLSEELRQAGSLFSLTISGQEEPQDREKHAFYTTINQYDQIVGIHYGEKYFGPEARSDVEHMVNEMIAVYKKRLEKNEWLSEGTIEKAIIKLNKLGVLVGYPDDFPEEYSDFIVNEEESLLANHLAFSEIAARYSFERWNTEVDRTRWAMSANTVNAYFNPTKNIICFPAAILRAPFYDIKQSPSENYGGIGAVIAHEISHAFDNNGAKFDEEGNLENWWTSEDFEAFDKLADKVIEQWDGLETDSVPVNGKLTVSENIADAGGLACALEAVEQDANPDYEDFFFNWARIWAQKAQPEYKQLLLKVDVHAPNRLRANIPPQNLTKFHELFQTQPGDGMYMKEADRIMIW